MAPTGPSGGEMGSTIRAVHVVPLISREASGPTYAVTGLCQALAEQGVSVILQVLREEGADYKGWRFAVEACRPWLGRLGRLGASPEMHRALARRVPNTDVVHNHSLWLMPNIYPGFVLSGKRCRLVTSPHGVFAPWAWNRSRTRKRILWWAGQRRTVLRTDCFHATADAEYADIRARGLRSPVAVIPLGIEPPTRLPAERGDVRRLLFLGRIHPTKRIDALVEAWSRVAAKFPEWELRLAGPVDSPTYHADVRRLVERLRAPRVRFVGPVYGHEKWRELGQSELLVLPSHSENFGVVVAEALACGVPVITTRGTPWAGLEREGCGWWIEGDEATLAATLETALATSRADLTAMGERGAAWVLREFSWKRVGEMMAITYSWLVHGGSTPPWVRLH